MSDLERLRGSIPPVVTPIRDGEVDYEAYRGLVEFQVAEGSHAELLSSFPLYREVVCTSGEVGA